MRRYNFVIFVFLLIYSCNSSGQQKCSFCGNWKWEKNDEKHDFTLQILQKDTIVVGKHCYILNAGSKMDCSDNDNVFSFKFKPSNTDSLVLGIRSYYSNQVGQISLKYKNGKIYWKLVKAPKGEYYLPREAVLTKY
ncbi:MAG: hypothetical protein EHM93_17230 [Bacteroidales bacterium]|nr:MAG: hypothetical protein EHM93_17230 [Bacteroidales bacterium]